MVMEKAWNVLDRARVAGLLFAGRVGLRNLPLNPRNKSAATGALFAVAS
jgi:hypothetical protein